ncbi:hypothetical protein LCGC14_0349570 [marine sediment metagenome]|uniref:Transketolase-like pyrimidine-binding domain-containing protein n=1 Tax=marine sediment metagenome TaxID=412755 RepID=A0A0F9TB25_9ZZZZ
MRKTCFDMIYELAKKDKRIVYIGSDVGAGTLQKMKEEMPNQFFMEGIQEQNIIGMATGLALSGRIVYVNTLACFLTRRCYEQVYLDVGLHNANVRLLGNGGGLVYAPLGPSHIACDDIALMRNIPNMTIVAPADADEMARLMPQTVDYQGPMYIRLAIGGDPIVSKPPFEIGRAILMKEGERALVITTGITLKLVMAVDDVTVIHLPTPKPIDEWLITKHAIGARRVIVIEEHNFTGGIGSAVAEIICARRLSSYLCVKNFYRISIPDVYVDRYGTQESLMEYYGITTEGIENAIS